MYSSKCCDTISDSEVQCFKDNDNKIPPLCMDARAVVKLETFCHNNEECPQEHICLQLKQNDDSSPTSLLVLGVKGSDSPIVFLGHPSALYYSSTLLAPTDCKILNLICSRDK
jgi:hypothetical protein